MQNIITISLQAFIASSIFFVWVVRYANIIQEFKAYGLPDWLRDFVGTLKLTFGLLLVIGIREPLFAILGAAGIAMLMTAAIVIHIRVKNPVFKMIPALSLFVLALLVMALNSHVLAF